MNGRPHAARALLLGVATATVAVVAALVTGEIQQRKHAWPVANAEAAVPPRAPQTAVPARGLWVWHTRSLLADPSPLLDFCRRTGTNEVYLSVPHEVLVDPRLSSLVARLASSAVRVEALIGDASWYRSEQAAAMVALIDDVLAFDARSAHGFAAIHLDVEPHTLPENRDADVMSYLPAYLAAMHLARETAARGALTIGADIPRKFLQAPTATRLALEQTVPRLFVMLYPLRHHLDPGDIPANELAAASRASLRAAYDDLGASPPASSSSGQMIIGIGGSDYRGRLGEMRAAVERANASNPRYGGWAIHDFTEMRDAIE